MLCWVGLAHSGHLLNERCWAWSASHSHGILGGCLHCWSCKTGQQKESRLAMSSWHFSSRMAFHGKTELWCMQIIEQQQIHFCILQKTIGWIWTENGSKAILNKTKWWKGASDLAFFVTCDDHWVFFCCCFLRVFAIFGWFCEEPLSWFSVAISAAALQSKAFWAWSWSFAHAVWGGVGKHAPNWT